MREQRGFALVVTLVLLTALGALALAAAAAAAAALALSSHQQFAQIAFQAAEAGIAESLLRAGSDLGGTIPETGFPESATLATFEATTSEVPEGGALPAGFTIGENAGAFAARHFFIVSDGRSGRSARVRLEQGFYLVEPAH